MIDAGSGLERHWYVRNAYPVSVEYGTNPTLNLLQPNAAVYFGWNSRCGNNDLIATECDARADFYDTPMDLLCPPEQAATCSAAPSFWSSVKLASVSTLVWDGTSWNTQGTWETAQTVPPFRAAPFVDQHNAYVAFDEDLSEPPWDPWRLQTFE